MKVARDSAAVASEDNSDDFEREESLSHGKYAIKAYDDLLSAAEEKDVRDAVVEALGKDVDAMKHELYMSRKQRVWMGWRGWF